MPTVHILLDAHAAPKHVCAHDIILYWGAVPASPANNHASIHSLTEYCAKHMLSLRAEFTTFIYDLGGVQIKDSPLHKHMQAGDTLSMWWCSLLFEKHPQLMPELTDIFTLRAVERLLSQRDWDAMHICGKARHNHTAIRDILRTFCQAKGKIWHATRRPYLPLWRRPHSLLRHMYVMLPFVCQALIRFTHWLWTVRRLMPTPSSPTQDVETKNTVTIVAYFPHENAHERFRSPYWKPLQELLQEEGQRSIHWLFVRITTAHTSLRQAVHLCLRYTALQNEGRSFHFMESFLSISRIWHALWRFVRLAISTFSLERHVAPFCHFENKTTSLNFWPLLRKTWRESFQGWRCLERCLQRQALLGYAQWSGAQDWTLFPWENCPWERMLADSIRTRRHKRSSKTQDAIYAVQHSMVRPADFRYFDDARLFTKADISFLPDKIFVNGQHAYAQLVKAGVPPTFLHITEALRYTHLVGALPYILPQKAAVKKIHLIVLTGFFHQETRAHMLLLEEVARLLAQDARISIKSHPYCSPDMSLYPVASARAHIFHASLAHLLRDAVQDKDALTIVWTSNSTTAAVEAALMAFPVIVQAPESALDLCPLYGLPSLYYARKAQDILRMCAHPHPMHLSQEYFCLPTSSDFSHSLKQWKHSLSCF